MVYRNGKPHERNGHTDPDDLLGVSSLFADSRNDQTHEQLRKFVNGDDSSNPDPDPETDPLRKFVNPDDTAEEPEPQPEPEPPPGRPVLADQPDLIAAIERDITALGLVGERDNALTLYTTFTSRLLDKPVSAIVRGKTSSGKSHTQEQVARLFPPESKIEVMGFTNASLFNSGEDFLKHKILVYGERSHKTDDEAKDLTRYLRQLLSEGKITRLKSVPGEGGDGRWVTEHQTVNGPVAFVESTTSHSIFEEDLNRRVQLWTNDSPEQNLAVMLAAGSRYDPDRVEVDEGAVIERHYEFQRSLKVYPVVVPFWKELVSNIPHADTNARRVGQQVLSMVEAVTVLHQHNRKTDAKGRLVATLGDYKIVRRLLLGPIERALDLKELREKCEEMRTILPGPEFDSKQALTAGFANKVSRDHTLKRMAAAGMVKLVARGGSHKPARWRWASAPEALPEIRGIPGGRFLVTDGITDLRSPSRPPGYDAMIRTPRWFMFARKVREFWGGRCAACNAVGAKDVHHRTYERMGREEFTDCVLFCRECHDRADEARRAAKG